MAVSAQDSQKLRINVNLLHPKEAPAKLPERFIKWLITYGRFIVILVEVIVVGAFLTRFKLDADLDNLKTKINQDLPYVEGLEPDETLIRITQNKLGFIDKTYLAADKWQETVVEISNQTPGSIVFTGLALEGKDDTTVSFRISAGTTSNSDLGIFLNNLRSVKSFKDINLASIAFEQNQIIFAITGNKVKI